jgi:integrase/recombinase XerD
MGVDQLIDEFLADCLQRNFTEETVVNYRSNLRIFDDFVKRNGGDLVSVDVGWMRRFHGYLKDERGNSLKRISNYFSSISSFYDFLMVEERVDRNPVIPVRKRYLRNYKKRGPITERQCISVDEMSMLVHSILDPMYKAMVVLFAKTGIRRGELVRIELDDVNWVELSIMLKPCAKRTNLKVFFDDEAARILKVWLQRRAEFHFDNDVKRLFVSKNGTPLQKKVVTAKIRKYAERVGLHDHSSDRLEKRFTPHCFRHWFTTWLRRNEMPREYIKMLRGDAQREAIDVYDHIEYEELRIKYIECVPKLGI